MDIPSKILKLENDLNEIKKQFNDSRKQNNVPHLHQNYSIFVNGLHEHGLTRTRRQNFYCNICSKKPAFDNNIYYCNLCDWDICNDCLKNKLFDDKQFPHTPHTPPFPDFQLYKSVDRKPFFQSFNTSS